MKITEYTTKELQHEARQAVKGKGKLLYWSVMIRTTFHNEAPSYASTYVSLKVAYLSKDLEAVQHTFVAI